MTKVEKKKKQELKYKTNNYKHDFLRPNKLGGGGGGFGNRFGQTSKVTPLLSAYSPFYPQDWTTFALAVIRVPFVQGWFIDYTEELNSEFVWGCLPVP